MIVPVDDVPAFAFVNPIRQLEVAFDDATNVAHLTGGIEAAYRAQLYSILLASLFEILPEVIEHLLLDSLADMSVFHHTGDIQILNRHVRR